MNSTSKIYLNCHYHERNEVKALGAWYDWNKKKWYVRGTTDLGPFQKWLPLAGDISCTEGGRKSIGPEANVVEKISSTDSHDQGHKSACVSASNSQAIDEKPASIDDAVTSAPSGKKLAKLGLTKSIS